MGETAMKTPTNQEYTAYDEAYDYFNRHLFAGQLPACLITLQRSRHAYGYFSPKRFISRNHGQNRTDEIALNPDTFAECSDKDILSTLVHEACHLWQAHFGKPGRRGYHNRQWAHKMIGLGLRPVSLDQPGKMTGQAVTHDIIPGGPFDVAAEHLLATGFQLTWQSIAPQLSGSLFLLGENGAARHDTSKRKYKCSTCGLNVWAKPKVSLVCGQCLQEYVEQCDHLISPIELSVMSARFGLRPCL
jgi:hypothetical protein